MLRSLVGAAAAFLLLAGPAAAAGPALVEVLDAQGRIAAQGGAGSFAFPANGAVADIGSARATPTGVELADVSLLGSRVQATRVVVPRHGLRSANVEGLVVDGRIVPGRPNTLVPLGGSSYLVVLQTAVVPGKKQRSVGLVGVRAVAIAERFLGVPYVWGGADPATGFDCSGLVMYVYAQLGIDLLHFSGAQYHEGAPVPFDALAPGDLVFFDPGPRGPGHVGIYIGGGDFIQAPHSGDVVKISSLSEFGYASSYVGAVRPYAG